jgi:hypothetical protein
MIAAVSIGRGLVRRPVERSTTMRFMMLMYPGIPESEWVPDAKAVEAMTTYNEQLAKAGVLLALDGLHPQSTGARVSWKAGKPVVIDGPFTEAKEVVGGYWIIQVKSRAEAIEWAKRCPCQGAEQIELRQVFELSDFPADVQAVVDNPTVNAAIDRT